MNQQLLNPFAQDYPESVEATFQTAAQRCCFNHRGPYAGSLLALGGGGVDGSVEVLDMETKALIRSFEGHGRAVESLRNNRYLLSASRDMRCIIWDLSFTIRNIPPSPHPHPLTDIREMILFDDQVVRAVFHPKTSKMVLVMLAHQGVWLVDLREGQRRVELRDVMEGEEEEEGGEGDQDMEAGPSEGGVKRKGSISWATFHPDGLLIYAGTTKGAVLTIDVRTRYVISRAQIATSALKQMAFDRSGRHLIINSSDRALRLLSVDPSTGLVSQQHKFQDIVNKTPWNAVGFSGDGEYVMGGAGTKISHNIYIWDRAGGRLIKVLEGPKDSLDDCDWAATRPTIASVTSAGMVNIWQTTVDESWSAFAPGFEELEENREFEEKEETFDIEDEEKILRRKQAEEEQDIDVLLSPPPFLPDTGGEGWDWAVDWRDEDDQEGWFPHVDLEMEDD